jgi:hypothetical protein
MRHRGYPIASDRSLVAMLRSGRRLLKTFGPRGPQYEISGQLCDPAIVEYAMQWGWLTPIDTGLLGPATAQSWKLKEGFDHEW